jgi:hypothetical protein
VSLIVLGVSLWALTQDSPPMVTTAAEGWSRGRVLGFTSVKRQMALEPVGSDYVVVWPNLDGRLQFARIGPDGEIVVHCTLPVGSGEASEPRLETSSDGRLHLAWREGELRPAIHSGVLDEDGSVIGSPEPLASGDSEIVGPPALTWGRDGNLHALWTDAEGIRWAVLDAAGEVVEGPDTLIPGPESLQVQTDETGLLHLAWSEPTGLNAIGIYYAILDPSTGQMTDPQTVTEMMLSDRLQLEGMALALSDEAAYVLWSEYDRGFDRYRFQSAALPIDAPTEVRTETLRLTAGAGPETLFALEGQHTPAMVAVSERVRGGDDRTALQLAVLPLVPGGAEEVVTGSTQASMDGTLVVDGRGQFHMAWLETAGFGRYRVVYASTAPDIRTAYNRLTPRDAVDAALSNVFQLSMVVVAAMAGLILWGIAPLLGLVIYHILTSDETLEPTRARVALAAALVVEVGLTFAIPPQLIGRSTWAPLRWVAPAVSAVMAAAPTAIVTRRQDDSQLFLTFFVFTVVNTVTHMAFYLLL